MEFILVTRPDSSECVLTLMSQCATKPNLVGGAKGFQGHDFTLEYFINHTLLNFEDVNTNLAAKKFSELMLNKYSGYSFCNLLQSSKSASTLTHNFFSVVSKILCICPS